MAHVTHVLAISAPTVGCMGERYGVSFAANPSCSYSSGCCCPAAGSPPRAGPLSIALYTWLGDCPAGMAAIAACAAAVTAASASTDALERPLV